MAAGTVFDTVKLELPEPKVETLAATLDWTALFPALGESLEWTR